MAIKAAIFDLDGTITQPYFDFDVIRAEMGIDKNAGPVWEAMRKMTPLQRRRAEQILQHHEKLAVEQSELNPAARETLLQLRQSGIGIGILTRNRRENALAVAEKHRLKFDVVLGREQGPVKPDAFGVLEICRQLGSEPAGTLVVGDYLYDMLCAKAAGAVAVLLANHPKADEFSEHADFTIQTLDQIMQIIKQTNGLSVDG
ncbi:MAG: HAD family hydrolase [Planctomycetota bacterium]|jgi:HAD superfamily hydrolase (TIGR01509 family)